MKRVAVMVGVACLLGACQTKFDEGAVVGQRVDDALAPNAMIHYDQVVILDKYLQSEKHVMTLGFEKTEKTGRIAVESQGVRRNSTGTVHVTAQLRNRTDSELKVQARVSFFDAGYSPIDEPSGWQLIVMPPNAIGKYEENSLVTDVAHYIVEIRGAY